MNISPHFYGVTFLWSSKGYECVATALAGFVQASFGAIDPFGDAVLRFISRTRRGFSDDCADSEVGFTPGRPGGGGDLPEFFGKGPSTLKRSVRQNENERPGRIFHR